MSTKVWIIELLIFGKSSIRHIHRYWKVFWLQNKFSCAEPLHCPIVLPLAPSLLPQCSFSAPSKAAMLPSSNKNDMYIISTPNLGLAVAVFVRGREHGRFRGSTGGAKESIELAPREQEGARSRTGWGAAYGSLNWLCSAGLKNQSVRVAKQHIYTNSDKH